MLAVVGTVPDENFPLVCGPATLNGGGLSVGGREAAVNRGTGALLAAALRAGQGEVFAFLAGDIGRGRGSRRLYEHLAGHLHEHNFSALAFHYLQPDVDWHGRVLLALQEASPRPKLIADAGFMYAAKMSGQAEAYDLFTPDVGELAFLADEKAPHPFYTRGFILQREDQAPRLIADAYRHHNAAKHLLVKGRKDYLASGPREITALDGASHPALEAIGGTGDTLTGMAAALVAGGMEIPAAAAAAAAANRMAGIAAHPTPSTQIGEIIGHIPAALDRALDSMNAQQK